MQSDLYAVNNESPFIIVDEMALRTDTVSVS